MDGEEFTMEQGEVKEYARTLHMKDGILERKLTWTASSGKMTEIHIFRLVSFARKNIMAIRYQVRASQLCWNGGVCVKNAGRCGKSYKKNKSNRGLWTIWTET